MTLSDFASIGSFVSGVAVVFSFVFLAIQIRQSNLNQKAIVQQSRAACLADMHLRLTEARIATAFAKGGAGEAFSDADELRTFEQICTVLFYNMEDTFLQRKAGFIAASEFDGFRTRMEQVAFARPGLRAMWRRSRNFYGVDFRNFIDELAEKVVATPPGDVLAEWEAAVAAEKLKSAATF